jgi:hypothetical protein
VAAVPALHGVQNILEPEPDCAKPPTHWVAAVTTADNNATLHHITHQFRRNIATNFMLLPYIIHTQINNNPSPQTYHTCKGGWVIFYQRDGPPFYRVNSWWAHSFSENFFHHKSQPTRETDTKQHNPHERELRRKRSMEMVFQ